MHFYGYIGYDEDNPDRDPFVKTYKTELIQGRDGRYYLDSVQVYGEDGKIKLNFDFGFGTFSDPDSNLVRDVDFYRHDGRLHIQFDERSDKLSVFHWAWWATGGFSFIRVNEDMKAKDIRRYLLPDIPPGTATQVQTTQIGKDSITEITYTKSADDESFSLEAPSGKVTIPFGRFPNRQEVTTALFGSGLDYETLMSQGRELDLSGYDIERVLGVLGIKWEEKFDEKSYKEQAH